MHNCAHPTNKRIYAGNYTQTSHIWAQSGLCVVCIIFAPLSSGCHAEISQGWLFATWACEELPSSQLEKKKNNPGGSKHTNTNKGAGGGTKRLAHQTLLEWRS